ARARRPMLFDSRLAPAVVQKPTDQPSQADLKVDAIRANQRPNEDGTRQIVQCLGRVLFPASRERSRRVPQPLLHWGIVSSIRDRIQDFDGIGEGRSQASDAKSAEM